MAGASTPSETTFISVLAFHTPFGYDKCHITLVNKSIYIFLSSRIMEYTVYRAGIRTGKYDRGGVWYVFAKKSAEFYKYLYRNENKLIYIHTLKIEIYRPFFIEIDGLTENYYPYEAYYILEYNNLKPLDPNRLEYNLTELEYLAKTDLKIEKEFTNENEKEELFIAVEKYISERYKKLGYDSIIFTSEGKFEQVFKFS